MKQHSDCPSCSSQDIEERDNETFDDGGKVFFACLECGCEFTQEYGTTITWFEESVKDVTPVGCGK